MACSGVVPLLLLLGVFHAGVAEVKQTQQTIAPLGEDAHFDCHLTQSRSRDVEQVTLRKVLPDGKKDIGSYSTIFGVRINPPFQGKVEFETAGLWSCSIVIRGVTKEDESCYHCVFNTYPDGAIIETTCLRVYEQYEPVLDITRSNSTEESLVSCSATGRPAPEVTLILSERDLSSSQNNTVSVTNPNGTVTVTATAVLSGFHGNNTQVGCEVRQFSVVVKVVFKTIPENNKASTDDLGKKPGADESGRSVIGIIIVAVTVAVFIAVVFYICWKQKNRSHKEAENIKTPTEALQEEPEEELMIPTRTEEPQEEPEEEMKPQTRTEEESSKEPEVEMLTFKSPTQEPHEGMNHKKEEIRQESTPWNEDEKAIKKPICRALFIGSEVKTLDYE